jgi:COP9 signalosome complex subunit 1
MDDFDCEEYSNQYNCYTKLKRLLWLSERESLPDAVRDDALRLALLHIETQTLNVEAHEKLFRLLDSRRQLVIDQLQLQLDDTRRQHQVEQENAQQQHDDDELESELESKMAELNCEFDMDRQRGANWRQVAAKERFELERRLENELAEHRQNRIQESVRIGCSEVGDHYYRCGNLDKALGAHVRTRDFCTTSEQTVSMCLSVMSIAADQGNVELLLDYATKARERVRSGDVAVDGKLRCALALAHVRAAQFESAARALVGVHFDAVGDGQWSHFMAPRDVACYGALCALATFDRDALRRLVVESHEFGRFLELMPEARQLADHFYHSRYEQLFGLLNGRLAPRLAAVDIYMHDRVDQLCARIRRQAIVQYVSPYRSLDVRLMAAAFLAADLQPFRAELITLIEDGVIPMRLDSSTDTLYRRSANIRHDTWTHALNVHQRAIDQAHIALIALEQRRLAKLK